MAELMKILSAKSEITFSGRTRIVYTLECGCDASLTLPKRHTTGERANAMGKTRMKCDRHPYRPLAQESAGGGE